MNILINYRQSGYVVRGTGNRGLMRGMATLPQGNQELLVAKDKVVENRAIKHCSRGRRGDITR